MTDMDGDVGVTCIGAFGAVKLGAAARDGDDNDKKINGNEIIFRW